MEKSNWKAKWLGLLSAATVLLSPLGAFAGNLDPTGNPADGSAMPTLQGIYDQLSSGTPAGNSTSFQEPATGPTAGTGKTLNDIKAKLPAIDDTNGAGVGEVLSGKTFWGLKGGQWGVQTGTVPAGADISGSNGQLTIAVPFGQYSGSTTATANDTNLISGNIKSGATIFGVGGSTNVIDTSGATAADIDMLSGKTAYVNGSLITGTVPAGSSISGGNGLKTIAITDGLYSGSKTVTANDANLTSANIKAGTTIFGVAGTVVPRVLAKRVNKTGQTQCWDALGALLGSCAETGQDGAFQYGIYPAIAPTGGGTIGAYNTPPYVMSEGTRFIDNGDGTVTDNLTALIWMKDANCTETVGGIEKGGGPLTWTDALTWCSNLAESYCGLSDGSSAKQWRLPNINELHSLGPTWPAGNPFINGLESKYWSSTTYAGNPASAWVVDFVDGYVIYGSKDYAVYVRCVRSGQ